MDIREWEWFCLANHLHLLLRRSIGQMSLSPSRLLGTFSKFSCDLSFFSMVIQLVFPSFWQRLAQMMEWNCFEARPPAEWKTQKEFGNKLLDGFGSGFGTALQKEVTPNLATNYANFWNTPLNQKTSKDYQILRTKKKHEFLNFRKWPNASEATQMHPIASERIRTQPNRVKHVQKRPKTWKSS